MKPLGMEPLGTQAQVLVTIQTKRWPTRPNDVGVAQTDADPLHASWTVYGHSPRSSSSSSSSIGRSSSSSSSAHDIRRAWDGTLTVEQLGHMAYVLRYKDDRISRVTDIDDITLLPATLQVTLCGLMCAVITLLVPVPQDWDLLQDCVSECRKICDLSLRLEYLSRDFYYAPVYLNGEVDKDADRDIARMREWYVRESARVPDFAYRRVCQELGIPAVLVDDQDEAKKPSELPVHAPSQSPLMHLPRPLAGRGDKEDQYDVKKVNCVYCAKVCFELELDIDI